MSQLETNLRLRYLEKYGRHPLSSLLLYHEILTFPLRSTEGFIGYRAVGNTLVAIGDPVCAEGDYALAAREFIDLCKTSRGQAFFLCCGRGFREAVSQMEFDAIQIGEDFIFDVATYKPAGDRTKMVRLARNHALRLGAVVKEYQHSIQLDAGLEKEFCGIASRWLGNRNHHNPHLMCLNLFEHRGLKRYFYAEVNDRPVAFITCLPILAGDGMLMEDVIREPDAPYGISELITLTILDTLKKDGGGYATFGFSPNVDTSGFPDSTRIFADAAVSFANQFMNLNNLHHFRKKFHASIVEPSYLLKYPRGLGPFDLARLLIPLAKFFLDGRDHKAEDLPQVEQTILYKQL